MNRVFIDMDGVIVDFARFKQERGLTSDQVKHMTGAYVSMLPIEGALSHVRHIMHLGFEVWIATKPPTGAVHAYSEKAAWVLHYLPELSRRIIITHDKGLLGDDGDYLLDDRAHKANCMEFKGRLITSYPFDWHHALTFLEYEATRIRRSKEEKTHEYD